VTLRLRALPSQHMLLALKVLLLFALAAAATPAIAQDSQRCFPETGYCISGSIRQYWERNGGLAVFGYPISEQRRETVEFSWTGPVQWFERDRLEDHSNEGKGVMTGRLGARYLELTGRPWQRGEPTPALGPCRQFEQTGYQVCGLMLQYWRANGGLEQFGYPLTGLITERIDGQEYQVQYFERRRVEYHPEHAGTPHVVQLGLLGRDVFSTEGRLAATRRLMTAYGPDQRFGHAVNGVGLMRCQRAW
jgi:hypothetical protein